MAKKKSSRRELVLRPRFRVVRGGEIALGPGRVDLLEFIAQTGSLRCAAREMGMSYMRAWTIVKSLNQWFQPPLVEAARGGKSGGGATLTKRGRKVVELYRRIENQSQKAVENTWKKLHRHLR